MVLPRCQFIIIEVQMFDDKHKDLFSLSLTLRLNKLERFSLAKDKFELKGQNISCDQL
jgi:hypothetical protein